MAGLPSLLSSACRFSAAAAAAVRLASADLVVTFVLILVRVVADTDSVYRQVLASRRPVEIAR